MKEKILVINPPSNFFPLGMAYVLSCLERHGIDFDFTDAQFGNGYKKLLRKNKYRAVATGGLISQHAFFNEVSQFVREINPDIPIILGGNVTKDMRADFLFDKLHITYGIIGEAETSFPFLIDAILQGNLVPDAIPGLLYRDPLSGEIRKNPVRRLDLSAENILPAWHRFNVEYYIKTWELGSYGHRLCMPVITGRGCTGNCTFCSPTIGSYSRRPAEHVISEIEILCGRYVFDWIYFVGEIFYPTRKEIINFCETYRSVKNRKKWVCELRVDTDIDVDTLLLMKSTGCVAVVCGVESGSNRILTLMNKRTTREMITRFFRTTAAVGIPCEGSIQVGNEYETETEIKETIDMAISEEMRVNERLPITYPGTKIYENAVKRGLIDDEWEYLRSLSFVADIWDYSWSKKNYVNISAIPGDRFWETLVCELRRFNTFNLTRFAARKINYSYKFGMLIRLTGECAECGSSVAFVTPRKMLGIRTFCRECFRTVQFNLYELPEFNRHYRSLCAQLQKASRLAIAGTKIEASYMLQYDYFKLNYDTLTAFVEIDKKASGITDFCHLPRIRMECLPAVRPDMVLIVDDPFGSTELKLRSLYLRTKLQPPEMLNLLPDNKRPYKFFVRLARRNYGAKTWKRHLILSAIAAPIFIADVKAWVLAKLKSNYEAFNKNAFTRFLLEFARR